MSCGHVERTLPVADCELKEARLIASRDKKISVLSSNSKRTFIMPSTSRPTFRTMNAFMANVTNRHRICVDYGDKRECVSKTILY